MFKTTITKLPRSEIEIAVEMDPQEWGEFVLMAAKELSKNIKIEGFRPGNAPFHLVEQKTGLGKILEAAADAAVKKTYIKIILEKNIGAIARPQIQVLKIARDNPFEFKAKVAVMPEVALGDWRAIAKSISQKPASEIKVEEKEVDEALGWLQKSRAQHSAAPQENKNDGTEITQKAQLPQLDDAFAQSLGNFQNLATLKQSVKEGLTQEKTMREKELWRAKILAAIAQNSSIEIPQILLESETHKIMRELEDNLAQMGIAFETYLSDIKKTKQELEHSLGSKAKERVQAALILQAIAKKEAVEINDQELEAEISEIISHFPEKDALENKIDIAGLKEYTIGRLKNEKVFQLLESYNK